MPAPLTVTVAPVWLRGDAGNPASRARARRTTKVVYRMQDDDPNSKSAPQPPPILFVAPQTAPAPARPAPENDSKDEKPSAKSSGKSSGKNAEKAPEKARSGRRRSRGDRQKGEQDSSAAEAENPEDSGTTRRRTRRRSGEREEEAVSVEADDVDSDDDDDSDAARSRRSRRGRRGRGRGKGTAGDADGGDESAADGTDAADGGESSDDDASDSDDGVTRRRRRRRKRAGAPDTSSDDSDGEVVVKVRRARTSSGDDVQGLSGSTRLEAKRQRRREGRGQRRARPQVLSESEFLARRESVARKMVVRGKGSRTQIAVLEDDLLVEHFVVRAGGQGLAGNVYLGKVQNILPSMEAAFIDIGRGRNAVLYAGEVNWDRTGLSGRTRTIEQAMRPGDAVPVQVTKDPVGHKGARLTSHIALSGRHLVYVPHGNAAGISRKLPDAERRRLRGALKKLVPEGAGVIVRTAAEGAGEDDLERDIDRLQGQWEQIESKAAKGGAPTLLHSEPDLLLRVVRDVFNEDFTELIVDNDSAHEEIRKYLEVVSPDLVTRLKRHTATEDVFSVQRVDEQVLKALDRKVYLPSGGSLVIDRTEAMTVIDVNTGKFTGAGGNLEETVTRNNLEAAEEIVRQLRLRDVGGIIVIDFIDMVLESNRELVLRRLTECLGRDRTKHQVTEITSLGLVQMTRKRVGQGLLEAFSEPCEHCKGRGAIVHADPLDRFAKPEKSGGKSEGKQSKKKDNKEDKASKANSANDVAKSAAEPTRKIAEASAANAGSAA